MLQNYVAKPATDYRIIPGHGKVNSHTKTLWWGPVCGHMLSHSQWAMKPRRHWAGQVWTCNWMFNSEEEEGRQCRSGVAEQFQLALTHCWEWVCHILQGNIVIDTLSTTATRPCSRPPVYFCYYSWVLYLSRLKNICSPDCCIPAKLIIIHK